MRKLMMGLVGAALASTMTLAYAQDKQVNIAVSIPAADHGWTGGVVYHAERAAKILEANHPGLKITVKTSPDGASQANALEDLTTQGMDALVTLPHNSDELTDPLRQVKEKGIFVTVVD
ncbi:MAG: substrate-binding domain-containing protein, partial [Phyllobacterium sp.]